MKSRSNIESRRCRPLLGTFVEITVRDENEQLRESALASAFAVIEQVQQLMSFHDPTSDISRLNREAVKKPVSVHGWTWEVLVRSEDFGARSCGAFDIAVAPLLSKWGYLPTSYHSDAAATFRDIIFLPGRMIHFGRPLSIDLGGIAKGFAVDRAVDSLLTAGIKHGIVNAGGDLRTFGFEAQEIHLRDPSKPGSAAGVVQVQNRAIATSGVYFSRKLFNGMIVSPLIDAASRRPFTDHVSVAVSALDCLTADALTKVVLTQPEESGSILRWFDADAVILERGKLPRLLSANAPIS